MDIRNLQTDEIKDSKEWAEEFGLNRRSFERKVDNGELLFERVEKSVQEIAVENGYLQWETTDLNAESKPRVIPPLLEGYAENWTAPVGGFDYVLTQTGRRINLKHSPKDPRYNPEIDGTIFKGYGNYLDLNEIKLD